jgi:hypothetical protein
LVLPQSACVGTSGQGYLLLGCPGPQHGARPDLSAGILVSGPPRAPTGPGPPCAHKGRDAPRWLSTDPDPQGGPGPQRVGVGPHGPDLHGPDPRGPDLHRPDPHGPDRSNQPRARTPWVVRDRCVEARPLLTRIPREVRGRTCRPQGPGPPFPREGVRGRHMSPRWPQNGPATCPWQGAPHGCHSPTTTLNAGRWSVGAQVKGVPAPNTTVSPPDIKVASHCALCTGGTSLCPAHRQQRVVPSPRHARGS